MSSPRKELTTADLADILNRATGGALTQYLPPPTPVQKSLWDRIQFWKKDEPALISNPEVLSEALSKAIRVQVKAAEQGVLVNALLQSLGGYNYSTGVVDMTGLTMDFCRQIVHSCEIPNIVVSTRLRQVSNFAQPLRVCYNGLVRQPAWRIRATIPDQEMTAADRIRIAWLTQVINDAGLCAPPEKERPQNWQPGFPALMEYLFRDSLSCDLGVIRRWEDTHNPGKYPLVSFCATDCARYRFARPRVVGLKNGVPLTEEPENLRQNMPGNVRYVRQSAGGMKEAEFTSREVAFWIRNLRTQEEVNGYGYPEIEQALNAAAIFCYGRDYNSMRFRTDSLPRGMLTVFGNLDAGQLRAMELYMQQMLQGREKRWKIPIFTGQAGQGSQVQFTPWDLSPRDMEYTQFMHIVTIWILALFGMHPEECGLDAASPFRPPLSEASPDAKIAASQDSGLAPLLIKFAGWVNREILWKIQTDKRFTFEFVGLMQRDLMQEVQTRYLLLQAGLTTPRMQLNELDIPIPDAIKDDPALDLLMPYAEGRQTIMGMEQAQQAETQQQQAMGMQQESHDQQQDLNKVQAFQQMQQMGQEQEQGIPPGGSGMRGRIPMQRGGSGSVASPPGRGAPLQKARPVYVPRTQRLQQKPQRVVIRASSPLPVQKGKVAPVRMRSWKELLVKAMFEEEE